MNHYATSDSTIVISLGDEKNPKDVAKGLFKALRDLDTKKVDVILVEGILEKNEGLAFMNRIRKASSEVIKIS